MATDAASAGVRAHNEEIGEIPVFWRSAPGGDPPVVYLHGVPTSSDLWPDFLARTGGLAPDLPGFGRSAKRADWDYSLDGYRRFLTEFLDHLGVERFRLVVHDWGVVGLLLAQAEPERCERLVMFNAVPLLPGYRWHRVARVWRRRVLGELAMGSTTRWALRTLTRQASATPGPPPAELLDSVWEHFDQGTQRAILKLYRSTSPDVLGAAGAGLGDVGCPALILWGSRDPYFPPSFARAYAERLPAAELRLLGDAGHWPWVDRPDLVDEAAAFLSAR